jgi:hypothetical protein
MVLPNNAVVNDAWVFDKVVIAKLTNNTLAFYEKSLIAGNLQTALQFSQISSIQNLTSIEF